MATEKTKARKHRTQTQRVEETRAKILKIAVKKFTTRPFESVQVKEISSEANVAHGIIFHHFDNKRGLYLAVIEIVSKQLFEFTPPEGDEAPYDRIRSLLRTFFTRLADNEELFINYVENGLARANDREANDVLRARTDRLIDWVHEIGEFPAESKSVRLAVSSVGATVDRLILDWLLECRPYPLENLVEAAVDLIVGALNAAQKLDPSIDVGKSIKAITKR